MRRRGNSYHQLRRRKGEKNELKYEKEEGAKKTYTEAGMERLTRETAVVRQPGRGRGKKNWKEEAKEI